MSCHRAARVHLQAMSFRQECVAQLADEYERIAEALDRRRRRGGGLEAAGVKLWKIGRVRAA
jgi:hypothetical protein